MKNIIKSVILSILLIFTFSQVWALPWDNPTEKPPYCNGWNCWYDEWVELVKDVLDDVEKSKTLSEYIQDVVKYLLWFVTLVWVLYIIYAWFKILVWNWNEDSLKKSKWTILYVVIWIVVMWLAYPIVSWLINILNESSTT